MRDNRRTVHAHGPCEPAGRGDVPQLDNGARWYVNRRHGLPTNQGFRLEIDDLARERRDAGSRNRTVGRRPQSRHYRRDWTSRRSIAREIGPDFVGSCGTGRKGSSVEKVF